MNDKKLNLGRLNARQREAVLHGEGPLLILAGAGSGKTSTMAYRIAHLVAERKVPATGILGLSFTNKAAGELKERVSKLVVGAAGKKAAQGLTITTFHSLCVRLLRAHAEALGFQRDFTILDRNDQKDILKEVFKNIRIDDRKFDLDFVLFEIGQAKNKLLQPKQAEAYFLESRRMPSDYQIAAASAYGHYQSRLRSLNAMDFDDLLYHGVGLLERNAEIRDHYNRRFRYILVDEYQDTNPTQFQLLSLLTQKHQNLCVVGDDDQSIYAWRGADPTHILEFNRHFKAARTITLDQNYRSTGMILDAANAVMSNNKKRHPKKLWSDRGTGECLSEVILEEDRAEADFVAAEIEKLLADEKLRMKCKDIAVLYRSNSQSRVFEEALRRNRIPYKIVGGLSFLDRKEVKDVLSLWRLVLNPKDDASMRRVLSWYGKGVGRSTLEVLGNYAFEQGIALFEALSEAPRLAPRSAPGAAAFRATVLELEERLRRTAGTSEALVDWARETLQRTGVKASIDEGEEDPLKAQRQWENVEELVHSIGQIRAAEVADGTGEPLTGALLLREFIARMTLEAQDEQEKKDEEKDKKGDEVTLLTLHGAKGLEYPVVFLVGMEEGFLPHKRTIEEATDFSEERRLAYVGITRAKDRLFLTRAKNRIRFGKSVPRTRSRFMDEIPEEMIVRDDHSTSGPNESSAQAQAQHEVRVKGFLDEIRSRLSG